MTVLASDLPKYPISGGHTRIKLKDEARDLRLRNDSLDDAIRDAETAVAAHIEAADQALANARRISATAKAARNRR